MHNLNEFSSRDALDQVFAAQVSEQLQAAINSNGKASIAFSGGSTPKGFFKALSEKDIEWQHVVVTLADERWLESDDSNSNARLLSENLLQNNASAATFFNLKKSVEFEQNFLNEITAQANAQILPFDVVILGMGEDGHTASIFPCSAQVHLGLDAIAPPALIKVVPTTAPFERITFNYNALITATNLYLHIVGQSKLDVLNKALANENAVEMPIRAFLHNHSKTCEILWAE